MFNSKHISTYTSSHQTYISWNVSPNLLNLLFFFSLVKHKITFEECNELVECHLPRLPLFFL